MERRGGTKGDKRKKRYKNLTRIRQKWMEEER